MAWAAFGKDLSNRSVRNDADKFLSRFCHGRIRDDAATHVALFACKADSDGKLSFEEDDQFQITDEETSYNGWFYATHLKTGEKGYVPANYLLILERHDSVSFIDAEKRSEESDALSVGAQQPRSNRGSDDNTQPRPKENPFSVDLSKETTDKWEIPKHKVTFEEEIGNVVSGTVWKGKWCGFTDVAIKVLTNTQDTSLKEQFLKEAAIMKKLRHKNLLALYGVCTKEEPFALVLEYMPNGHLKEYLLKMSSRSRLREPSLVSVASQIADAMTYLENHHIIHMDLAARNVLVGESDEVKVSNFGLARYSYDAEGLKRVAVKWLAPELFVEGAKPTHKCDVWSFAVLLYELFTYGETPYPDKNNSEVSKLITKPKNYRMEKPPNFPVRVYDCMLKCWHPEPENRPSFFKISKFFENYADGVGDAGVLTP